MKMYLKTRRSIARRAKRITESCKYYEVDSRTNWGMFELIFYSNMAGTWEGENAYLFSFIKWEFPFFGRQLIWPIVSRSFHQGPRRKQWLIQRGCSVSALSLRRSRSFGNKLNLWKSSFQRCFRLTNIQNQYADLWYLL